MGPPESFTLKSLGKTARKVLRWGAAVRRKHHQTRRGAFDWYIETGRRLYLVSFRPWRGHMVIASYTRHASGGWNWLPDWTREEPKMRKRPKKSAENVPESVASTTNGEHAWLNPMSEHMATIRYEDGDPRKNGLALLLVQGSEFIVLVKDPSAAECFRARGATLMAALETACLHLACGDAPWEPDLSEEKKVAEKRKK